MTKTAPAAPDATLALQAVAKTSNEMSHTSSTLEVGIFDDFALIGALIFGADAAELDHQAMTDACGVDPQRLT
jgi:hypothetical protein